MNKYEVVGGVHVQDGREYKKGEVVESHLPLSTMFINKFKDLGPVPAVETAPVAVEQDEGWENSDDDVEEQPLPKSAKPRPRTISDEEIPRAKKRRQRE